MCILVLWVHLIDKITVSILSNQSSILSQLVICRIHRHRLHRYTSLFRFMLTHTRAMQRIVQLYAISINGGYCLSINRFMYILYILTGIACTLLLRMESMLLVSVTGRCILGLYMTGIIIYTASLISCRYFRIIFH